jgi:flagellar basal body rod protein FlgC
MTVNSTGTASRPPLASALDVSSSGMQTAEGRVDADARSIATSGPDVESMVDLDVQTHAYGALARVIRASDEMTRSAIDLLA